MTQPRLYHGMWSLHLHSSTVKIQPCYPFLPLVEYMVKALCWLFLWNFKEKSIGHFLWHSLFLKEKPINKVWFYNDTSSGGLSQRNKVYSPSTHCMDDGRIPSFSQRGSRLPL